MLDLWFSEASQNLNSFRQLLSSLFNRGTKGKNKKTMESFGRDFEFFPLVPPLNNENKSCLNEFKFWEASENHNQVYAENFSCLFHVVPINLPRSPNSLGPRWSGPLLKNRLQAGGWEFASLFLRHNFFIASETGNQIVSILKSLNTVPFFCKSIWYTRLFHHI